MCGHALEVGLQCLSVDGKQTLMVFEHWAARTPHHAPSRHTPPQFGLRVQFVKVDESAPSSKDEMTFAQKVVGKLLHCARAVNPTMLHAINDTSTSAAAGTEATLDAMLCLLNCAHTNPNAEAI